MKTAFAMVGVCVLAGCAVSAVGPLNVPVQYKTMAEPGTIPTLQNCAGIASIEPKDARTAQRIGTRFLEQQPDQRADVTASGDIPGWVRSAVEADLRQASVPTSASGRAVLHVSLDSIATQENVYHRSGYEGTISLSAELTGGGKSIWKGTSSGKGENYGYAGSVENYQETLNHALDRAIIDLLNDREFRKAACT